MTKKIKKTNKQLNHEVAMLQDRVRVQANINTRSDFFNSNLNKTHNNTRDLYNVFGYKEKPTVEDFIHVYETQDIVKRVIDTYPKSCWSEAPNVIDNDDTETESKFEKAFIELKDKLKLFKYITRLDRVQSLGRYGVLFISVRDGKSPVEPLVGVNIKLKDILFLAPYTELNATIKSYETDPQNERFGLPLLYELNSGGYGGDKSTTSERLQITVHHTRIIHVAENLLDNDIFATPILKQLFNRFRDLQKVLGGSAETFYMNSRGGLVMKAAVGSTMSQTSSDALEQTMQDYTNGMTRYLKTIGIDVDTLEFPIADPKSNFEVQMAVIAGTTEIPQRILLGSESGQLASSQDDENWLKRVDTRRKNFCESDILTPLIDWFILHGVLPQPKNEVYTVEWEPLSTASPLENAEVAEKTANAIATFSNAPAATTLMSNDQFVTDVLKHEFREADVETDIEDPVIDDEPEASAIPNG